MSSLRPLEPEDAVRAGLDAAWAGPSGGDQHRLGLFEGEELLGAAQLAPMRRVRKAHVGEVRVHAPTPRAAAALLAEVCAFADGWTTLDRLQLELPADHGALPAAVAHGFAVEVRRAARLLDGRDEVGLGRLRPGFTPRPAGPPPPWPPRERPPPTRVAFRPFEASDAAAVRDGSIEPTTTWGTLMTPWSNQRFFAERFGGTTPENAVYATVADGVVAGTGGIHATTVPGVWTLGMAISTAWQGRGLGGRLLDHLIAAARERGARRLELAVWEDNTRARALYASRGFVPEGTLRFDAIRGGGHASSLEMARAPV